MVQLVDETGAPYSISGSTGVVQIREQPGTAAILEPVYTIESASNGEFYWLSPAASTASLAPGVYQYAARVTFSDGSVRTIVEGLVTVRRVAVSS